MAIRWQSASNQSRIAVNFTTIRCDAPEASFLRFSASATRAVASCSSSCAIAVSTLHVHMSVPTIVPFAASSASADADGAPVGGAASSRLSFTRS